MSVFMDVLNEGFMIFVDSKFGNDTTAVPNQRYKPFRTIAAAVNKCKILSGQYTISVAPGIYKESQNLLVSNANYFFEVGATLENNFAGALFEDSPQGLGVNCLIQGYGSFVTRSRIENNNGVIGWVSNGPIFKIRNERSRLNIGCNQISSIDVESLYIENCNEIILQCHGGIYLNGDNMGMRLNGYAIYITSTIIQGTCLGIDISVFNGGIQCNDIKLNRATISIEDTLISPIDQDVRGVQYVKSETLEAVDLTAKSRKTDILIQVSDAKLSSTVLLENIYSSSFVPTLIANFDRLYTNTLQVKPNKGNLTVMVNITMQGNGALNINSEGIIQGDSTIKIDGCPNSDGNTFCLIQMKHAIVTRTYVGRDETDILHQSGLISVIIDQLQANQTYAATKYFTGISRLKPRIFIKGNQWLTQGYLTSQTNGIIDLQISEVRAKVQDGGLFTVSDWPLTPAEENKGLVQIHDSLLKNEQSTYTSIYEVITLIHAPQETNNILSMFAATLSIGLPYDDPNVPAQAIRVWEPVYPVENFVVPPLLTINSYKQLTTRLIMDLPTGPTRWSGTNTVDPRYLLL